MALKDMSQSDRWIEAHNKTHNVFAEKGINNALEQGFMLGTWRVEPMAGCIEFNGSRRHVEPKIMDVLLCLARDNGKVVSRDHIFEEVWRGLVVSDEVLTRAVSELRTLLNDTERERRYIRTVPKRGYTLIAHVAPLPESTLDAEPGEAASQFEDKTINTSASSLATNIEQAASVPQPARQKGDLAEADNIDAVEHNTEVLRATTSDSPTRFQRSSLYTILLCCLGLAICTLLALALIWLFYESGGRKEATELELEGMTRELLFEQEDVLSSRLSPPGTVPTEDIPTLAIMPFINLSGDESTSFFSRGLSEDIRSALIALPGLKVVARTSSEAFKNKAMDVRDIGDQLGVHSLLEGTVRVQGQDARITLQLTNTESGFPFWSDSYDYKIDDVFAIQKQIAEAVVKQLSPQLLPELPAVKTTEPEAHQRYLIGRHFWHLRTEKSLKSALENLQAGLEIDPNYARLHAALADAYVFSNIYGELSKEEATNLAESHVERALELNPDLPEAYASRGLINEFNRDYESALSDYQRAVTLNPNNSMALMWYGNALSASEDIVGAAIQYQKALELDPLHPVIQQNFLENLIVSGRGQQAANIAKAMHEVSGEERLLRPMLNALSKMGRYDSLLGFLVRYNFSEKYQDHSILMVADTLISLRRFAQVNVLLADQKMQAIFEGKSLMTARLAVAQRDSAALVSLVTALDDQAVGENEKHMLSPQCIAARKSAWLGLAAFMDGDYQKALQQFLTAEDGGYLSCEFGEDRRISLLLYLAETQNRLGNAEQAMRYFQASKARIDLALNRGWGETYLYSVLLGYYILSEQSDEVSRLLKRLEQEQIEPWSRLVNNPILDGHLDLPNNQALLEPSKKRYQLMRQKSKAIPLAKYGIE